MSSIRLVSAKTHDMQALYEAILVLKICRINGKLSLLAKFFADLKEYCKLLIDNKVISRVQKKANTFKPIDVKYLSSIRTLKSLLFIIEKSSDNEKIGAQLDEFFLYMMDNPQHMSSLDIKQNIGLKEVVSAKNTMAYTNGHECFHQISSAITNYLRIFKSLVYSSIVADVQYYRAEVGMFISSNISYIRIMSTFVTIDEYFWGIGKSKGIMTEEYLNIFKKLQTDELHDSRASKFLIYDSNWYTKCIKKLEEIEESENSCKIFDYLAFRIRKAVKEQPFGELLWDMIIKSEKLLKIRADNNLLFANLNAEQDSSVSTSDISNAKTQIGNTLKYLLALNSISDEESKNQHAVGSLEICGYSVYYINLMMSEIL
ncbi:MAG: hypothetical protein MHMPM18_000770 [Marteilia pararefringens]